MAVKTVVSGQFLVVEDVTQGQNKVSKPIDDKITGQSKFFSVNVSLPRFTMNQVVALNMDVATALYVRAVKTSDSTRFPIRVVLTESGVSVLTNDIRTSLLELLDCDISSIALDNDSPYDVEVEIIAVG